MLFSAGPWRLVNCLFVFLFSTILLDPSTLNAVYINRYTIGATNGGIAFTGNTIGLSKEVGQNQPGTSDAIGTFITTNSASQVGAYPASVNPPGGNAGTTLTWQINSSSAYLDLPAGSTILYAELIWGGSYGFSGQIPFTNNLTFIPFHTSVNFTTPAGSSTISSDPTTRQRAVTPNVASYPPCNDGSVPCGNYTVTQNVTALVQAGGAGLYTVGGVPATVAATDDTHNAAGWTLAVVYSNPSMITSNLTLFVGCQQASNAASGAAQISGFCAPPSGIKNSRLFVSALEGDYAKTGDMLLFGPTLPLSPPGVSGSNNAADNFFASQINTRLPLVTDPVTGKLFPAPSGLLDTRGSYGLKNFPITASYPNNFGRQGTDITSVDVTTRIAYNQTVAYAQGTTEGDDYTIIALATQIAVGAPILVLNKQVDGMDSIVSNVGDTVTYSGTITNMGTSEAYSPVLKDILETGQLFVSGSFVVNGVLQPDPDLVTGYSLPDFNVGTELTFQFDALINTLPPGGITDSYLNNFTVNYEFIPCSATTPTPLVAQSNTTTVSFMCPSPASIIISPTTLPKGQTGLSYSQTLSATGGTSPYTYSPVGPIFPGLSLSSDGTISGTPTTAGSFSSSVTATDFNGCPSAPTAIGITILGCSSTITITTPPLPDGTVGVPYSQLLSATGGTGPYSYTVSSGTLPPGLNLNQNGNIWTIEGTPTKTGTYPFYITATDSTGCSSAPTSFSITIDCPTITITTPSPLPDGQVGILYLQILEATGGIPPYTYKIVGGMLPFGVLLPYGVGLNTDEGIIVGIPIHAGTYYFTIVATDSTGCSSAPTDFSITITCGGSSSLCFK